MNQPEVGSAGWYQKELDLYKRDREKILADLRGYQEKYGYGELYSLHIPLSFFEYFAIKYTRLFRCWFKRD